jgi:hypothetical protein
MNDNPKDPKYGMGVVNDAQMQASGLTYKGKEVHRFATNPSGYMAFINTKKIQVKYLPHPATPNDAAYSQIVEGQGSNGMGQINATQIPIRIAMLSKTGESYKVMMTVTLQAAFTRPNAFAIIKDISES